MKKAKRNPLLSRRAARLTLSYDNRSSAQALPTRALFERWACAALQGGDERAEISLSVVDADEGRELNDQWRGKDYATNVLSFALNEGEPVPGMPLCGDLVLCAGVVEREAAEQGKPLAAHYAHLTVHGMLHLQGFDHEDDEEAEVMEALETRILARLGFADPYQDGKGNA